MLDRDLRCVFPFSMRDAVDVVRQLVHLPQTERTHDGQQEVGQRERERVVFTHGRFALRVMPPRSASGVLLRRDAGHSAPTREVEKRMKCEFASGAVSFVS